MNKAYVTLTTLFLAFFLSACQKDTISGEGNTNPQPTEVIKPDPVTANLQGNITGENNIPVESAAVIAGNKTANIDANGYFRIEGESLDKNVSLGTAYIPGYFKGYRVFAATQGTIISCNI